MPTLTTNYSLKKPNVNSADDEDQWGTQLNESLDGIDTQMKVNADAITALSSIPIGAPIPYFGSATPTNYLLCYGQTIGQVGSGADSESAAYETLFDIVKTCAPNAGTESFSGNDVVTIPDIRGRVVAGQDDMGGTSANRLTDQTGGVDGDVLGDTGGSETHTLTEAQLAAHAHEQNVFVSTTITGSGGSVSFSGPTGSGQDTGSAGSDAAHNNVQPTIILNYIVRYQ